MITRNFNLFLNAGNSIPLVINVNQFDSGEQWVFTLFNSDGTQYIPSTGAIVGIKSDGLGIINSGSVNESGQVVISETQQMTAAVGKAVFELMIDNQTHGTANFIVLVEEKPGNNADLSESDLSLLEEAINATSPLPTGGTVGQVLTKTANGSTWSDAGTPTQEQVADAVSDWADEHITVTTGVVIDDSLSVAGAAADAKATGDEISDLKSQIDCIVDDYYERTTNLLDFTFEANLWKQGAPNELAQGYTIHFNKKIPVTEGQILYGATKSPTVSDLRSVVFTYSSNDTFIAKQNIAHSGYTGSYTIPSGVAYVYLGFSTNSVSKPITPTQILGFGNVAYIGSESWVTATNFPNAYIPVIDAVNEAITYKDLTGINMAVGGVHTINGNTDIVDFYDSSVINYRIGTPEVHQYPYDITFTPQTGYRMYFYIKTTGATQYTGSDWKTAAYTIPANAKWTVNVAKTPEDTSVPAVLEVFQKAVKTSEPLATIKQKLESQATNSEDITKDFRINTKYKDRVDALTQLTRLPMFLIFTDIHGFGGYLERIGDFHDNNVPSFCKDVLCLGDIVYNEFDDDFTFMSGSDFGKTVLLTIGNHDCYDGTTVGGVSATDLYNKFFSNVSLWGVTQPSDASANGLCYYYKDYDNKIRLIVLNEYYWDNAQKSWFESTLASAKTAGLAVIVAQHQGNFTDAEYEPLSDYAFGTKGYSFIRWTSGYDERRNCVDAFISDGGEFIGWLSGHTHCEQFGTFTVNNREQFTMTFSNAGQDSTSRMKIVNYSQDCFYYLAIDTTNKWIYVLTIGQAVNKYFKRNLLLMYNYNTQEVVEYY